MHSCQFHEVLSPVEDAPEALALACETFDGAFQGMRDVTKPPREPHVRCNAVLDRSVLAASSDGHESLLLYK